MKWSEINKRIKRVWRFIWYDDSIISWLLSLIIAFMVIKFLVYPGLGLIMGTKFPIVAVVSNSMEHQGGFDQWWATHDDFYLKRNITKSDFQEFPFKNGFNKGDIMILWGSNPDSVKVGDIIVFWSGKPYPIIHRVVAIGYDNQGRIIFQTKGDFNRGQIIEPGILDETNVTADKMLGRAVLKVPYLGYVKIWFVNLIRAIIGGG